MEAAKRTISQILTEEIRYELPPYQRPYSWENGNVEQLLEDVWEAYEAKDEEYFIGSLITIEREKGPRYDVVDGQQRLTTLNLVFAKLRDAVDEPARSELGRRVLPRNSLTGEEESPPTNPKAARSELLSSPRTVEQGDIASNSRRDSQGTRYPETAHR
ncbi:MAG: DUF262 domain-containing protein [Rhodobacteraceae bacterium]|nr:DUF262 domain-containing protein [Paracoccaceae bacterium]